MLEQQRILAINSHKDVFELTFKNMDSKKALETIQNHMTKNNISYPQILAVNSLSGTTRILGVGELGERFSDLSCEVRNLASVTMTCQGAVSSELIFKTSEQLKQFSNFEILQDTTNLTVIASKEDREKIIKQLHGMIL